MSINPNWDKWIRASVNVYLKEQLLLLDSSLKIFSEGAPEEDRNGAQDWVEMRLDGPTYKPQANDEWLVTVEINLLVTSLINEEPIYRHREIAGKIARILSSEIPLKEYGDDDTMQFGCLQLKDIYTHYYERVNADTPMKQVTLDCFGDVYLTGG